MAKSCGFICAPLCSPLGRVELLDTLLDLFAGLAEELVDSLAGVTGALQDVVDLIDAATP
jgi:hypothetical protein